MWKFESLLGLKIFLKNLRCRFYEDKNIDDNDEDDDNEDDNDEDDDDNDNYNDNNNSNNDNDNNGTYDDNYNWYNHDNNRPDNNFNNNNNNNYYNNNNSSYSVEWPWKLLSNSVYNPSRSNPIVLFWALFNVDLNRDCDFVVLSCL